MSLLPFPKNVSASGDFDYDQRILGEAMHVLEHARGELHFNAKLVSILRKIGSASVVIVEPITMTLR